MSNSFVTWSTQWVPEDQLYYVRLDRMESGSCETIFSLDYGRFKTAEEAWKFIETLPNPYEAYYNEMDLFDE